MEPIYRPYRTESDYWRMREFLREVFLANGRLERSWHVARLDYARWHGLMNLAQTGLEEVVSLWETEGRLIACAMHEGDKGEACFAIHPNHETPELVEEMLRTAEQRLAITRPDGTRRLRVWAPDKDDLLRELLMRHGYHKGEHAESQWHRDLDTPVPDAPIPPGYVIRSLGDGLELLERCYASGLGFHEGDIKTAVENRDDPTWYRNIQTAPLYRRDLDIVAVAPDGAIAAFCTVWFDDVTRSAYFEPVATVPAHQRRGLARAVLTEGLRRLQRMGAIRAFVGGQSQAANALYQSVMGSEHEMSEPWIRQW